MSPLETRASSPELTVAVIEPMSLPVLLTVSLALSGTLEPPLVVVPSVNTIAPTEFPVLSSVLSPVPPMNTIFDDDVPAPSFSR